MLTHLHQVAQDLLALAPDPTTPTTTPTTAPASDGGFFNTKGVVTFLTSAIAPVLLAVIGIVFLGWSKQGNISRVMTSSIITFIGITFLGGAFALPFLGDDLVNLFISK